MENLRFMADIYGLDRGSGAGSNWRRPRAARQRRIDWRIDWRNAGMTHDRVGSQRSRPCHHRRSRRGAATLEQQHAARALLSSGQALFLPVTVTEELASGLRGVYNLPVTDVLALLEALLLIDNLVVDRVAAVARAVESYREGRDFSNALNLAQARPCGHLATFDARFRNLANRLKLQPPVLAV